VQSFLVSHQDAQVITHITISEQQKLSYINLGISWRNEKCYETANLLQQMYLNQAETTICNMCIKYLFYPL